MSDQRSRRFSPLLLALIAVMATLLVVYLIRSSTREIVAVRVSPVTHENLVSVVSTNGKVEPITEFQAHAPAAGTIAEIYVQVGQKVKAGDLLLRMDEADAQARLAAAGSALQTIRSSAQDQQRGGTQEELIANSSELTRARLAEQQATTSLDTLKQLQTKGAASSSEVIAAQDRLTSAEAALKTAQQRSTDRYSATDRARTAAQLHDVETSFSAARSAYEKAVVRAPFAGTVYSIAVNQYDFVPGGEDLLDLADLNQIHITAYFDEPEIGKLAVGQPVKIVWDAKPDRVWHGHVESAPTTIIAYNTRNVGQAIITVDDAQGDLPPNSNVTVTVTVKQRFNVLSVSREALHTEGATNFVYRVINRHLVRTVVQVGTFNSVREEIVSGLSEKDVVALNATSNRDLVNGMEIKPVE